MHGCFIDSFPVTTTIDLISGNSDWSFMVNYYLWHHNVTRLVRPSKVVGQVLSEVKRDGAQHISEAITKQ